MNRAFTESAAVNRRSDRLRISSSVCLGLITFVAGFLVAFGVLFAKPHSSHLLLGNRGVLAAAITEHPGQLFGTDVDRRTAVDRSSASSSDSQANGLAPGTVVRVVYVYDLDAANPPKRPAELTSARISASSLSSDSPSHASEVAIFISTRGRPLPPDLLILAAEGGWLDGATNYQVDEPGDPSVTITDIDRVEDGTLWEEKSATSVPDSEQWVQDNVVDKFYSYMEARQYLPGYENAPIGFDFTGANVDPELQEEVEQEIQTLRERNPQVEIKLSWSST